ncbi:formylglycine-generating enzyme family protein [Aliivibrio fischeri]|uniref:formylglycine-generating enzyme family protein n=1 Tax=Aliivibrio fischeri TaxID=668 RepID=UPI0007C450EA|nr:SUMF1/EgtB/PvdO family nonheme iron enzyme [Aliivibrio fischeri]MCE7578196.1 formylglycine-generating enzyme family protein [Aliivibrio fischeri]MCE7590583.1 formylglycine-generating enzyme family protein [Aliivibrio fischeri]
MFNVSFFIKNKTFLSISLLCFALLGCTSTPPHPITQKIEQNMVSVQGGEFQMGSNAPEAKKSEKPEHAVFVDDFYISKFEVTQEIFESVMGSSLSYFQDPNVPVNNLSWQQANFFIQKLNELTGETYRLPTEAEWEYAARGGNLSKGYIYSGSDNIDDVAWYSKNANNRAHPVGMKQPNELGLYDMTGNVGEFVSDAYDDNFYRVSPKNNPNNARDEASGLVHKSVRGSSFSYDANESENYRRDFASQSIIMSDMGLRLVRDKN